MAKRKEPSLADIVRAQMALLGMSQKDLAQKTGYCASTIHYWCKSPEKLTLTDFRLLNAVLHLPGEAFMKYAGFEVNKA